MQQSNVTLLLYSQLTRTLAIRWVEEIDNIQINKLIIRIDSLGGDVSAAQLVLSVILQRKKHGHIKKIKTIAYSDCSSAALIIWLLGDVRICHADTVFLVHMAVSETTGRTIEFASKSARDMYAVLTGIDGDEIWSLMEASTEFDSKTIIKLAPSVKVRTLADLLGK